MSLSPEREEAIRLILPHMAASQRLFKILYKLKLYTYPVDQHRQLRRFCERQQPN